MPTIHVIYDPKDRITIPQPEQLRHLGASAAAMSFEAVEIEPETINETAEGLAALLLNAIARDQEPAPECVFEVRTVDGSMPGVDRTWCQTHGFACPKLMRPGQ